MLCQVVNILCLVNYRHSLEHHVRSACLCLLGVFDLLKEDHGFSPVLIAGYGRLFDTSALLFLLSIDATGPLLKC